MASAEADEADSATESLLVRLDSLSQSIAVVVCTAVSCTHFSEAIILWDLQIETKLLRSTLCRCFSSLLQHGNQGLPDSAHFLGSMWPPVGTHLLRMTASRSLFMLQGLAKLLADNAPQSFKESKFENYFGRKIAVDASMHMYQFLVTCSRPTREHSDNGLSWHALCCSCYAWDVSVVAVFRLWLAGRGTNCSQVRRAKSQGAAESRFNSL